MIVSLALVAWKANILKENYFLRVDNKKNMEASGHQRWHYEWQMAAVGKLYHIKWSKRRHSFSDCCVRMWAEGPRWLMMFSHAMHSKKILNVILERDLVKEFDKRVLLVFLAKKQKQKQKEANKKNKIISYETKIYIFNVLHAFWIRLDINLLRFIQSDLSCLTKFMVFISGLMIIEKKATR